MLTGARARTALRHRPCLTDAQVRQLASAALVVEAPEPTSDEARAFARELRALGAAHAHTAGIKIFYFRPVFPVDVRHNAKIHRLTLAQWARTERGYESDPKR